MREVIYECTLNGTSVIVKTFAESERMAAAGYSVHSKVEQAKAERPHLSEKRLAWLSSH